MATECIFQNRVANTQNYAPDQPWDNKEICVANTQNYAPDHPWDNKETNRLCAADVKRRHGQARRALPGLNGFGVRRRRIRGEDAMDGNIPDPGWLCSKCDVCGTPSVIGCEHHDPGYGDEDSDESDVASLDSVETGKTVFNTAKLVEGVGSREWEARQALGYLHVSILLGEELLQVQVPGDCTFEGLKAFTEVILPLLPIDNLQFKYDVYLPGASKFMALQTLYERFCNDRVDAFLDNNILRMRGSIGLAGGAGRKGKPKQKPKGKPKSRANRPKTKKLMGKAYPNQNAMTDAMFGVRIPKQIIRGNSSKQKLPTRINATLAMSACTAKFLRAVIDPFGERDVCLPSLPVAASLKSSGFARYDMYTGDTSNGFVVINPTWVSDLPQGFLSGSDYGIYPGGAIGILAGVNTIGTGVQTFSMPNLPYSSSNVTATNPTGSASPYTQVGSTLLQGRVVACGLRVTYIGTTINESGVSYCYVDPQHQNIFAMSQSGNSIASLLQTDVKGVTRDPCNLCVYPITEVEMTYPTANPTAITGAPGGSNGTEFFYTFSQSSGTQLPLVTSNAVSTYNASENSTLLAGVTVPAPIAGYYVTVAAPATFLVELIVHVEYIGPTVAALATPNIADPVGLAHATTVLQQVPIVKQANPHMSLKDTMMSAIRDVAQQLKPVAVSAVVKGLSMLMV